MLDFKAATITDSTQAGVIREKQRDRMISSRLVLHWKETDTGYKADARWCVHGFKDPDIHEIERSCPTPEVSSINVRLQILASTASEGTLADAEKACMRGDPSVREKPLHATPPSEGPPGVFEGALIRLDEVYGLVDVMSEWRSRIVSQLKEEGCEVNVYEPCLFSKYAVNEEQAVDRDPEDDEPMVVEGDVMDVRLGRPDSQPEPELNAPANSNASSRSARSETYAEPEAEVSTSAGTDMEFGVSDRRVRFREERDSPRHHLDVPSDQKSMEEPPGSRDELRQANPLSLFILPKQARPSYNR